MVTIKLRPHHLLCLLTYLGKGYSPAFVENYDRIAKRITDGEDIIVVEGPDDICAPLLDERGAHCHHASVRDRDLQATADVGDLLGIIIAPGVLIRNDPMVFRQMRAGYADGLTTAACTGCPWSTLCATVAEAGYGAVRVHGSDHPQRVAAHDR